MTALAVSFSVGTLACVPASAASGEWMLNRRTLSEDGQAAAPLRETAKTESPFELTGGGATINCTGLFEMGMPEVIKRNKLVAKELVLTDCSASGHCEISPTIDTLPIEAEVTVQGTSAVRGVVKPKTGSILTSIIFKNEECALEGDRQIKGNFEITMPTGQREATDQLVEVNQSGDGLLKFDLAPESFEGSALLLLANDDSWSFL